MPRARPWAGRYSAWEKENIPGPKRPQGGPVIFVSLEVALEASEE